jgi:hypothetical protein
MNQRPANAREFEQTAKNSLARAFDLAKREK